MMRLSKSFYAILLALLLAGTAVTAASAHAVRLLRSDPANGSILSQPPSEIRAWFGEEMKTGVSTLQVFNSAGRRVDNGDGDVDLNDPDHASLVVTLPSLPEGEYWVRWYVVLWDNDASESSFNFFVGDETAAVTASFAPADGEVFYYQAEEDNAESNLIYWLVGGGLVGIGLLTIATITMRRKPAQ